MPRRARKPRARARPRLQRRGRKHPALADAAPLDIGRSFRRIRDYVGFAIQDSRRLRRLLPHVEPRVDAIIDDFYRHIEADPRAARVLTGGPAQVARLKQTLRDWVIRTLRGPHDAEFVHLQAAIGRRHVQVGLEQAYMVGGMHLLRSHLARIAQTMPGRREGGSVATLRAVDRVLDVALALMLETYREDSLRRILQAEQNGTLRRLAAIGEMAASIAHEVRNPLAGISGAIQVLRGEMTGNSGRRDILEEILAQVRRLDTRIHDLLLYARPAAPRREPVRPVDLLETTARALKDDARLLNVRLRVQAGGSAAPFPLDPGQIQQVLMNLILNGVQAMQGRGEIRLEARCDRHGALEITVEDGGPGVPEQMAEEIFRPFFTTRPDGTGLGLAISRKIAEAHGGSLHVDPGARGGARFTLVLPPPAGSPSFDARMRGSTQAVV